MMGVELLKYHQSSYKRSEIEAEIQKKFGLLVKMNLEHLFSFYKENRVSSGVEDNQSNNKGEAVEISPIADKTNEKIDEIDNNLL